MTEQEAMSKWCPFTRVPIPEMGSDHGIAVGNRFESNDDGAWNNCNCIGSACMAWRRSADKGAYCGLVGKP